jgi:phage tail sheath gpL-like
MTANHGGEAGNSIDLKHSYNQGEVLPAGITLAIVPMASGSANPVITPALTAIADSWFNVVAMPYTDAANLTLLEAELDARWGPLVAMEGVAFAGMDDTHANLLTFGDTRNSEFVSVLGTNDSPTPPWEWAAALAGVVSKQAQIDPARPFQTLELKSVLAPIDSDRFNQSERNLLLLDGIATSTADRDGTVRIERLITTYQTNAGGLPDISFLDANTLFTLGFLRFSLRARFFQKYPRHKLADDGTRVGAGQAVLTPTGAKSEVLSLFRLWEDAGLVEGITQFKDEIIIERNANDPTRLDFRLPPDLVNQLRVTATQIQFLL